MNQLIRALLLSFAFSHAAQGACETSQWTIVGNLSATIQTYDALFTQGSKEKDPVAEFNSHLRKYGLLQTLSPVGRIKGFPNRLEADSAGGMLVGVFLKKLEVSLKSNLSLDQIFEVASRDSTKAVHTWLVPYGISGPAGVDTENLFYTETFTAVCTDKTYSATVRVGTDRNYELVKKNLHQNESLGAVQPCKAAKVLFKNSAYATCGEFVDLRTKKKRILVWELPMT